MNISLRQIKAFVLLADAGSFTQAARQLFVTQSALSLLIRELETTLCAKLVNRTTRHISLTPVGSEFLLSARRVLAELDQALDGVDQLLAKRRGRVVVAAPLVLSGTFLSPLIAEYLQTFPQVEFILKDCLPDDVLPLVRAGAADLGIGTFHRTQNDLQHTLLFRESLVAVFQQSDPNVPAAPTLPWAALAHHPVLVLPRGSIFRDLAESGFLSAGVTLQPRLEASYVGTLMGLVRAGLGVAVVPGYATRLADDTRLTWRRLVEPVVEREVVVVQRKGLALSPAATAFIDVLQAGVAHTTPTT